MVMLVALFTREPTMAKTKFKRKPSSPRNIKFRHDQEVFIQKLADAQGHGNFSRVVKAWTDREMGKPAQG